MKTVRRPPYPKWNPGYFPCSSLTPPSAFLTPSIGVLRWIRVKESQEGSDPIAWLHKMLQEQSPSLRTPIGVEEYEMQIGGYRIKYGPAST